jgi:hypothetical protein
MSGTGEEKDYNRVRAFIERKIQVDRTQVLQTLRLSAGDVKAIAARMEREGILKIQENERGGATYTFIPRTNGKGVTPGPSSPAPAVTPPGRVTGSPPGPRLEVTPPSNGALKRIAELNGESVAVLVSFAAGQRRQISGSLLSIANHALSIHRDLFPTEV